MGDYDLYHADRRKHKYIKKIGKRYFYTQDQIRAYLDGKKESVEFDKIKDYSQGDARIVDGKIEGGKTIGGRIYYNKNDKGGYNDSIGGWVEGKKLNIYSSKSKKKDPKTFGRVSRQYDKEGDFTYYTIDFSKRKSGQKKLKKAANVFSKHSNKSVKNYTNQSTKGKKQLSKHLSSTVSTMLYGSNNVQPTQPKKTQKKFSSHAASTVKKVMG